MKTAGCRPLLLSIFFLSHFAFCLEFQTDKLISRVEFSPDGKLLYAVTPQGIVGWDTTTGAETFSIPSTKTLVLQPYSLSPDGNAIAAKVAVGDKGDTKVIVWPLENGKAGKESILTFPAAESLRFSPDGKKLFGSSHELPGKLLIQPLNDDKGVEIENQTAFRAAVEGKLDPRERDNFRAQPIDHLAFYQTDRLALLRPHSRVYPAIQLWDIGNKKLLQEIDLRQKFDIANVIGFDINQDGQYLALVDYSRHGLWWVDVPGSAQKISAGLLDESVAAARFSEDDRLLVAGHMVSDGREIVSTRILFYERDAFTEAHQKAALVHSISMAHGNWLTHPIAVSRGVGKFKIANVWPYRKDGGSYLEIADFDDLALAKKTFVRKSEEMTVAELWDFLAIEGKIGFGASTLLIMRDSAEVVKFLKSKTKKALALQDLDSLYQKLNDPDSTVRQSASAQLKDAGPEIRAWLLEKAKDPKISVEQELRIEALIKNVVQQGESIRDRRTKSILSRLSFSKNQDVLKALAEK